MTETPSPKSPDTYERTHALQDLLVKFPLSQREIVGHLMRLMMNRLLEGKGGVMKGADGMCRRIDTKDHLITVSTLLKEMSHTFHDIATALINKKEVLWNHSEEPVLPFDLQENCLPLLFSMMVFHLKKKGGHHAVLETLRIEECESLQAFCADLAQQFLWHIEEAPVDEQHIPAVYPSREREAVCERIVDAKEKGRKPFQIFVRKGDLPSFPPVKNTDFFRYADNVEDPGDVFSSHERRAVRELLMKVYLMRERQLA